MGVAPRRYSLQKAVTKKTRLIEPVAATLHKLAIVKAIHLAGDASTRVLRPPWISQ